MRTFVLELEVLVRKLLAVDTLAAAAVCRTTWTAFSRNVIHSSVASQVAPRGKSQAAFRTNAAGRKWKKSYCFAERLTGELPGGWLLAAATAATAAQCSVDALPDTLHDT